MNDKIKIDDLFHEHLADGQERMNIGAWANMSRMLDGQNPYNETTVAPKKYKKRYLGLLLLLLGFATFSTGVSYYLFNNSEHPDLQANTQVVPTAAQNSHHQIVSNNGSSIANNENETNPIEAEALAQSNTYTSTRAAADVADKSTNSNDKNIIAKASGAEKSSLVNNQNSVADQIEKVATTTNDDQVKSSAASRSAKRNNNSKSQIIAANTIDANANALTANSTNIIDNNTIVAGVNNDMKVDNNRTSKARVNQENNAPTLPKIANRKVAANHAAKAKKATKEIKSISNNTETGVATNKATTTIQNATQSQMAETAIAANIEMPRNYASPSINGNMVAAQNKVAANPINVYKVRKKSKLINGKKVIIVDTTSEEKIEVPAYAQSSPVDELAHAEQIQPISVNTAVQNKESAIAVVEANTNAISNEISLAIVEEQKIVPTNKQQKVAGTSKVSSATALSSVMPKPETEMSRVATDTVQGSTPSQNAMVAVKPLLAATTTWLSNAFLTSLERARQSKVFRFGQWDIPINPGVFAGLNASFFNTDHDAGGFQLATNALMQIGKNLNLVPGLGFYYRNNGGYSIKDFSSTISNKQAQQFGNIAVYNYIKDSTVASYNFKHYYSIEAPILLERKVKNWGLYGGVNLAYGFKMKTQDLRKTYQEIYADTVSATTAYTFPADISTYHKPVDFNARLGVGYVAGFNYNFMHRLFFDCRLVQNITDNSTTPSSVAMSQKIFRTPSIQLNLGYRFKDRR